MMNEMTPQFHEVKEVITKQNRGGNTVTTYVLKYNAEIFNKAICKGIDTELFYPNQEIFSEAEERIFRNMCVECPVMMACLEWALAHELHGIWAGTTPANRRGIRNRIRWAVSEPKM